VQTASVTIKTACRFWRKGRTQFSTYISPFLLPLSIVVAVIWVFCISLGLFVVSGLFFGVLHCETEPYMWQGMERGLGLQCDHDEHDRIWVGK